VESPGTISTPASVPVYSIVNAALRLRNELNFQQGGQSRTDSQRYECRDVYITESIETVRRVGPRALRKRKNPSPIGSFRFSACAELSFRHSAHIIRSANYRSNQ